MMRMAQRQTGRQELRARERKMCVCGGGGGGKGGGIRLATRPRFSRTDYLWIGVMESAGFSGKMDKSILLLQVRNEAESHVPDQPGDDHVDRRGAERDLHHRQGRWCGRHFPAAVRPLPGRSWHGLQYHQGQGQRLQGGAQLGGQFTGQCARCFPCVQQWPSSLLLSKNDLLTVKK